MLIASTSDLFDVENRVIFRHENKISVVAVLAVRWDA